MGNIGMRNLHHLLLALLVLAVTGCGTSNTLNTADNGTGSAAITAKLQWGAGKTTAKTVAAIPAGVTQVRMTVTGTGDSGSPIPVVSTTMNVTAGDTSAQGQIDGIYPGKVTVSVTALDNTGAALYEGYALNIAVTAGNTSDAGTIVMSPPIVKAADTACLTCHETTVDDATVSSTGQNIVADYKQSAHYTTMSTGCAACHGASHNAGISADPAADFKCVGCHDQSSMSAAHVGGGTMTFRNGAPSGYTGGPAPYLHYSSVAAPRNDYANNCTACHEPHNPLKGAAKQERADWAASRHAETTTDFFNGHSTGSCSRCHNPYGLAAYLSTGNNSTAPYPAKNGSQVLACNACHTNSATGALRTLAGTTAQRGYSSNYGFQYGKKQYPEVGATDICIVCHAADNTNMDPGLVTSASTTPAANNHHGNTGVPAATFVYVKRGFLNLSTGTNGTTAAYMNSLKSDQDGGTVTSTHRKLGTSAIIGDTHKDINGVATFATAASAGALASNGPCVACHLTGSHTLQIDQAAITAVCNRCHFSEAGNDITTISAFETHFLEPQQEVFLNALQLAMDIFNSKQSVITLAWNTVAGNENNYINAVETASPTTTATAADWTSVATGVYANKTKLLGAVSNVMYISSDKAAYAHARTYTRRLLYDTLDFLDDGILNMSVSATAVATSPTVYGKGAAAYTDSTLTTLSSGTTESMVYLIGWSRSTGAWNAVERP